MSEFTNSSEGQENIPVSAIDGHQLNCYEFACKKLFGDEKKIDSLAPSDSEVDSLFTKVDNSREADVVMIRHGGSKPFYSHMGIVQKDSEDQVTIEQVRNTGLPIETLDKEKFLDIFSTDGEIVWLKKKEE